jgi:hypothetical protein
VKVRRLVVSARQVKALREGTAVVAFRLSRKNGSRIVDVTLMPAPKRVVKSRPTTASAPDPDPSGAGFRDQILALLNSGGAHVAGHATIDGQDTIEIDSADGHTAYYVDPANYAPVKLTTRGDGGGTALRFRTYENLPFDANRNLLSLEAQHPTARIDHDPPDYRAAQARLFPHG